MAAFCGSVQIENGSLQAIHFGKNNRTSLRSMLSDSFPLLMAFIINSECEVDLRIKIWNPLLMAFLINSECEVDLRIKTWNSSVSFMSDIIFDYYYYCGLYGNYPFHFLLPTLKINKNRGVCHCVFAMVRQNQTRFQCLSYFITLITLVDTLFSHIYIIYINYSFFYCIN